MKTRCLLGGSLLLLAIFIGTANSLCVLESDFGFKINCAFKKSGLFRVRNLGGIKAHASLGFSLGDELGFEQSLTNLDPSRRRSVSVKNGVPPNLIADTSGGTGNKQEKRGKQNRIMRPSVPSNRPSQAAMDRLTSLHRRVTTMQPIIVPGPDSTPAKPPAVTMAKPMPMGVPPFKPLPPKEDTLTVVPIPPTRKTHTPLQIPQSKGPGLAYQSEIYPQSHNQISKMVSQMTAQQYSPMTRMTPTPIIVDPNFTSHYGITTVNPFVPMPHSGLTIIPAPVFKEIRIPNTVSPSYIQNSVSPSYTHNSVAIQKNPLSNFVDPVPHQVHDLASAVYNTKKIDDYNSITGYGDDTTLKFNKEDINMKIAEIAKAGNISMEAVEAAIALRQQQLLSKYANIPVPTSSTTSSTSTTTTDKPFVFQPEPEPEILTASIPQKPKRMPTSGKVMNAPREYYPVGYEKNFDDQFQTKVDLPETSFHCGDQKYFPGLYGDESLGCMVFHVCALTDDGLVMKSFLCPESTLFDQTILKCNWWFYVDCKNTKKLYDTNIPVSKSYQLMKALTFFSSYKKEMQNGDGQPNNSEDMQGIKDAISMLENQHSKSEGAHSTESPNTPNAIQFVTPTPIIDERNNRKPDSTETSPIYRGNRNYDATKHTKRNTTVENSSEIKLITLNADMNFSQENKTVTSSDESKEKKHRRRMTLKYTNSNANNTTQATTSTTSTSNPKIILSSPLVEMMKKEIQPIENSTSVVKEENLTDQIEDIHQLATNLAPVRRFYRSSAEKYEEKEVAVINNKKVQIVRPTSTYTGQYATPAAAIDKLDEAILGKRTKKETIAIVSPQKGIPKT